ncbi:helix-turn-helix domain-containing protein [Qipengyuania seohaensis]|uniref:helix-turn-helix domain-containing protein n=1 Tax=Qipengyuania seohaensis TaxID=266951 RepID=UPI0012FD0C9B
MSFQISVTPKRRAAARFVTDVRRKLLQALADEPAISQSDLARALDVNRSVISKQLAGRDKMSLSRVAELAWALGYEPEFQLSKDAPDTSANWGREVVTASTSGFVTQSSTASDVVDVTNEKSLAEAL